MLRRALSDKRMDEPGAEMWMRRAIEVATGTKPHPNPRVGAVVVAGGRVVGEGAHLGPGTPHAEVVALEAAGDRARGATIVVTLEPCSHHGRTPPCTTALIEAGVSRVIVGAIDPDDRVQGTGVAALEAAGIDVELGMVSATTEALDLGYFHHRRTGLPRVTLKLAATLDGQIAASDGTSQWITGPEARRDVHVLRGEADAVVVGAGTLIADDPRLDVRLTGYTGSQPRPVVIAGNRQLPPRARLWDRDPLVYSTRRRQTPGELIVVPGDGEVDLGAVVKDLGDRGYLDVLVEGGATLAAAAMGAGLIDRLVVYLGGKIAGGQGRPMFSGSFGTLTDAIELDIKSVAALGPDVRIEAEVR